MIIGSGVVSLISKRVKGTEPLKLSFWLQYSTQNPFTPQFAILVHHPEGSSRGFFMPPVNPSSSLAMVANNRRALSMCEYKCVWVLCSSIRIWVLNASYSPKPHSQVNECVTIQNKLGNIGEQRSHKTCVPGSIPGTATQTHLEVTTYSKQRY